jgi:putative membrane protein
MKSICLSGLGLGLIFLVAAGCRNNSGADSVKQAEKENNANADSLQKQKSVTDSSTAVPSKQDAAFLVKAYSGGMMEVQLGKMAMTHAAHPGVKDFGTMMVRDHGMGADTLRSLALGKHIVLPDSVSNDQKKERDDLMKKHGLEFDRSYIRLMVKDHKDDISEFEKAAKNANDPDIKSFAERNVAMLQQHLDSAQRLDKKVGKSLLGPNVAPPY